MSTTWMDGASAVRELDLPDIRALDRIVAEGLIGVRPIPGVRARYRRDDVEKLARLQLPTSSPTTEGTR